MADISIVLDFECPSILNCIEECKKRGIKCEIVSNEHLAKGDYIVIPEKDIYYNDLFLYYPYICLEFGNKNCSVFSYYHVLNYNSEDDMFHVINKKVNFHRNKMCKKIKTYKEYDIMPGCSLNSKEPTAKDMTIPGQEITDVYKKYFVQHC